MREEQDKITVIIHTYNASQHLDRVLDHLKDFDELLVCDMESTDNTLEIAQRHGCNIIHFPKGNHQVPEPARDYAIRQAAHPWILEVDADELVTPALVSYLYESIRKPDCPDGLYIPRKNYFMGRFMHCLYPNHILRFFRRDVTTWPPYIHSLPTVNGKVEYISRRRKDLAFIHLADESISDWMRKSNGYTDEELLRRKDKHYGAAAFFYRPLHRFYKYYIQKGGFRDGMPGLIRTLLSMFYQVVLLAKMYEQKKKNPS
jgi:glycosyltransferase involved in cell wall biosynthesis